MPKDKFSMTTRIKRTLQVLAGLVLVTALIADPGCQPKDEAVVLDEPSVSITPDASRTQDLITKTSGNSSASAMTVMDIDEPRPQVNTTVASPQESLPGTPVDGSVSQTDAKTTPESSNPVTPPESTTSATIATLVQNDPLAAFKQLHTNAVEKAANYTCTFIKQERIGATINKQQTIKAKFRAEPYSVFFHFVENPGLAGKVIYIKDKWVAEDASDPELRQLAAVRPAGLLGIAGVLKQPIRSERAKKAGRRFIDQFGFERGLELLVRFSQMAADEGKLTLEYQGQGEFKGRPVWLIKRLLPYTDDNGVYPDRLALIYIDQEWGIPIAIHTFRSDEPIPEELLGKYEYTDIDFDATITDKDFDPDSI